MLAAAALCAPLIACHPRAEVASASALCPRPSGPIGVQPAFSAQEQEVRVLRQQAFGGDFFAQLDLARRYSGRDAREKNLEDPIEAAVWFELALANPDGYAPSGAWVSPDPRDRAPRAADCRAGERQDAAAVLERLLDKMSSDERQDVRTRVIYVLSTQGAPGLRTWRGCTTTTSASSATRCRRRRRAGDGPICGPSLRRWTAAPRPGRGRRPCSCATTSTSISTTSWRPRPATWPAMSG
jgi:hypothetical protein